MSASKFDKWFIAQHGKRPSKLLTLELLQRMSNSDALAGKAERLARDCMKWDAQYKSAMYAWNIKDKDK